MSVQSILTYCAILSIVKMPFFSYRFLVILMVVKFFPSCVRLIGLHGIFWVHGCISILICFLSIVILPETQGKTFTELSEMYSKKKTNREKVSQ